MSIEVEQLSDKAEVIEMNIPQLTNVCDQAEERVNVCASRAYTFVFLHDYVNTCKYLIWNSKVDALT